MHDLASFVLHLHFFLGVTVLQKRIDMRQNVEGDRMRINFAAASCLRIASNLLL